jgi:hypothetical protein
LKIREKSFNTENTKNTKVHEEEIFEMVKNKELLELRALTRIDTKKSFLKWLRTKSF